MSDAANSLYKSCEAKDDSTAVINITHPTSKFPTALSLDSFSMQSPKALKAGDANNVTKQGEGFDRAVGRDKRQPDCPAFAGEGLGHRLNHFVIVASRRSDGNPESYRPQYIIQCARGGAKNKKSNGQDEQ